MSSKIADQATVISKMKGEYENFKGEVHRIDSAPKPPEVTMEDINIMKRMIHEMKAMQD